MNVFSGNNENHNTVLWFFIIFQKDIYKSTIIINNIQCIIMYCSGFINGEQIYHKSITLVNTIGEISNDRIKSMFFSL